MGVPLSEGTEERLARSFAPAQRDEARRLLVELCGEELPLWHDKTPEGLERARHAVLKLAAGDLGRLCDALELAALDWRDLLVGAGFANDLQAHREWWP